MKTTLVTHKHATIDMSHEIDLMIEHARQFYARKHADRALIEEWVQHQPETVRALVQEHCDDSAWAWPGRIVTADNILPMLDTLAGQRHDAIAAHLRTLSKD